MAQAPAKVGATESRDCLLEEGSELDNVTGELLHKRFDSGSVDS